MKEQIKVLQLAATDVAINKLLLPLIDKLDDTGYDVHIACSPGKYVTQLSQKGYKVHTVNIRRRINPTLNLKSLWELYLLLRKEHFDIVHVHTPVAAALGRIAAYFARVPVVIYTAHGFYFHDNMPRWKRRLIIWVEKLLCHATHLVFTQSNEDAVNAVKDGICSEDKVKYIGNGVDITCFDHDSGKARANLGLKSNDKVVGFVGRLVREKGILELVEAMQLVIKAVPDAKLLVIGDKIDSDRDKSTKQTLDSMSALDDVANHCVFTGFIDDVPATISAIDIFVLPSYREGMPRSIIEAMASGKPVIATDIRGSREEVLQGETGFLVPVKNTNALAEAITTLLSNPALAQRMGAAGHQRAREYFDERMILDKQINSYEEIIKQRLAAPHSRKRMPIWKFIQLSLKRLTDIAVSCLSLTIFALPFMVIALMIKLDSAGPIFFLQERAGKNGQTFRIWKFRTMVEGAVNQGLGFNVAKNDSRITRVGNLLRNWGVDELPQLINVLKGEMSIVGPRPALCYQAELYDHFQRRRLAFRPGITSLAVVKGRNLLSWKERIKLDVYYIEHWSIWSDWNIIFRTFWAVLVSRKGIYGSDGKNDDFMTKNPDLEQHSQNTIREYDQVT